MMVASRPGEEPGPLYEWVARRAAAWNDAGNVGLVVGATYPKELRRMRELCPDMPVLMPGIGAQAGDLEESVRWGTDGAGRRAIVSSSRGVLYASRGADFATAARKAAQNLRDAINRALEREGHGWS